jgi:hypothetical protein
MPEGIRGQRPALIRVIGEQLAGPADEPVGCFVTSRRQQVHKDEDLFACEPADPSGLVLEFGVDEIGHQVVGPVVDAPTDVRSELLTCHRLH